MRRHFRLEGVIAACMLAAAVTAWGQTAASPPSQKSTLEKVRARGSLTCGVDIEQPEYSLDDAHGNHAAFDTDLCKAVAVAVLGTDAHFTIKPYRDESDSLAGLDKGEIDLLATASMNIRTANGHIGLGPIVFYDAQGLLVPRASGVHTAGDLAGKKICFLLGTEIEAQLTAFMRRHNVAFIPGPFSEEGEMEAALVTHNCDAISADVSQLGYEREGFKGMAAAFIILPDIVADDPLAPAYRSGDSQWAAIVNWTMYALIEAEHLGITSAHVHARTTSTDPEIARFLGTQRGYGQFLGLSDDWAARVVASVGNYGEIFERDLGSGSSLRLDRGVNKPWTQGGLLYAPPWR